MEQLELPITKKYLLDSNLNTRELKKYFIYKKNLFALKEAAVQEAGGKLKKFVSGDNLLDTVIPKDFDYKIPQKNFLAILKEQLTTVKFQRMKEGQNMFCPRCHDLISSYFVNNSKHVSLLCPKLSHFDRNLLIYSNGFVDLALVTNDNCLGFCSAKQNSINFNEMDYYKRIFNIAVSSTFAFGVELRYDIYDQETFLKFD